MRIFTPLALIALLSACGGTGYTAFGPAHGPVHGSAQLQGSQLHAQGPAQPGVRIVEQAPPIHQTIAPHNHAPQACQPHHGTPNHGGQLGPVGFAPCPQFASRYNGPAGRQMGNAYQPYRTGAYRYPLYIIPVVPMRLHSGPYFGRRGHRYSSRPGGAYRQY